VIRDRLPNEYLPDLIDANGEELVRETLASHFISPAAFDILMRKPFSKEDFEAISGRKTKINKQEELLKIY